jgi:WD40 repeat protein
VAVAWQSSWDKSYAFRFAPASGPISPVGQVAAAMTAAFSADGRRLFVGEASGGIAVWDVAGGFVRELRPPASRRVVAWEADENRLTLMGEQPLRMWIRDEVDTVRALAISPDGKRLAVGSKSLFVLDAETGRSLPDWHGHEPWTPEDATEVILLSEALGLRPDSRWPAAHHGERSPLDEPALLDEELSARQLAGLSREDLFVVRNLVHARRGRPFKSGVLRDLFQRTGWYKPDPAYTEARLTDADRSNLRRMAAREKLLGGRMSERQFLESNERGGAEP